MFFLTSHKNKINVGFTPKCGCTVVKRWFMEIEGKGELIGNVRLHKFLNINYEDTQPNENYFTIVVIRNPWHRILSAYVDKVVLHPDAGERNTIRWLKENGWNPETLPTFREFITFIWSKRDLSDGMEAHIQPQAVNLPPLERINKIILIDNFNEDILGICDSVGIDYKPIKTLPVNSTKFSSSSNLWEKDAEKKITDMAVEELRIKYHDKGQLLPPRNLFFDKEIVEKIGEIYSKDLEVFGELLHLPEDLKLSLSK